MEIANITGPVILIKSKFAVEKFTSERDRYEYTRGCWRLGKNKISQLESIEYVFLVSSVKDGKVRILEIYKPLKWLQNTAVYHDIECKDRWQFIGSYAEDDVKEKYVGKEIEYPNPSLELYIKKF
jgi:hypothetical protein